MVSYIYSFYMILQTSTLSFSSSQTNKSQEVLTRRINQESEVLLGCELGNPKWLTHVNNCMSWVCPSSIHFHSVPRQGSGTGYGRGVSQWRWKHNRGAVGQNRISFGKWQSVSIRFLGVSENGVCHQITVATTYILYIYPIYITTYHQYLAILMGILMIFITGASPGTSELRSQRVEPGSGQRWRHGEHATTCCGGGPKKVRGLMITPCLHIILHYVQVISDYYIGYTS